MPAGYLSAGKMAKNIVICSDGTGNKGGYADDSNVYKLYRYINIHDENHPQITYYNDGVGANKDGEPEPNTFCSGGD